MKFMGAVDWLGFFLIGVIIVAVIGILLASQVIFQASAFTCESAQFDEINFLLSKARSTRGEETREFRVQDCTEYIKFQQDGYQVKFKKEETMRPFAKTLGSESGIEVEFSTVKGDSIKENGEVGPGPITCNAKITFQKVEVSNCKKVL